MVVVVMANPRITASHILSIPFKNCSGNFTCNSIQKPFSFFGLGNGILRPPKPKLISAFFHSNFSSNREHPRSMFEKITKLDDALQLFDEMTQTKPLPSVVKFNHLLHAITKMKHYYTSIELFKQMNDMGVPVDAYTTNIVIKCCCQLYCTSEGFAVIGYALKIAVLPDVCTFTTLLNGLIIEDRVLEADTLFKKLIRMGICEPDVFMYNTMIKGLCKFGTNNTALALLRLMDERSCKPDVFTYSTIIDSLCKDKMIDDALKLFKEMVFHKGILPNVVTYSSLIHGLCKLSRWDDVYKVFKEMEDERISLDVHTFTILIDALSKEGKVEDAEALMNIMIKRGLVPNVFTYSSLLNGYCKKLKIDEAMHLFREMAEKGFKPDVVTYGSILQGLFDAGRCGAAHEFFNEMRANGHTVGECTYRIIMKGLCDNRQLDEALCLFRLTGVDKLNLDINVYNILIDGGSKCGKLDVAMDLFNDLLLKGLHPNVRTYTVMISSFCREGLVMEAKRLFLKMKESGCSPNEVTYRVILQGYLKNKHYDDVVNLLEEMERNHFLLDASTLSLLLDQIVARPLDKTLLELINKVVPKESIDAICFSP